MSKILELINKKRIYFDGATGSYLSSLGYTAVPEQVCITDPEVILADEPTGNLDVEQSKAICALLKELNLKEKCSILLVTHDPVVAAAAGKVHLLKDGRIGESFPVSKGASEISERYLETYR